MLVLATVRVVGFLDRRYDDLAYVFWVVKEFHRSPSPLPSDLMLGLLAYGWPLILVLLILLRKNPWLVRGAALAFLILSIDRLALLVLEVASLTGDRRFALPDMAGHGSRSLGVILPLALVEMMLEAYVAVGLLRWDRRYRRSRTRVQAPVEARQGIASRMAIFGSLLFAGCLLGNWAWQLYENALSRFPTLRTSILSADSEMGVMTDQGAPPRSIEDRKAMRVLAVLNDAAMRHFRGDFPAPPRRPWRDYASSRISTSPIHPGRCISSRSRC